MTDTRTSRAMGGSKPKSKKKKSKGKKKPSKFAAMHIRGTGNDQFMMTHDQHPGADGMPQEPEEHVAENSDSLMEHMAQHAPNLGPQDPAPPAPVDTPRGSM